MNYKKDIKDMVVNNHNRQGGMEVFCITISKKCERLATAIYLVTNFLSDTEPMKARLRTLSLELVRDASLVKNGNQAVEANVLEALRVNILETLSLFELAFIAGLVSEMNFTILKREYASLRDSIEVKKASRESRTDTILGDNFFYNQEPSSMPKADASQGRTSVFTPTTFSKGHPIGQTSTSMSDRNTKGQTSISAPVTNSKFSNQQVLSQQISRPGRRLSDTVSSSVTNPRATTGVEKEARRTRILKLIKDNREVTIKDIVAHFPDLSEKTIQRELVAMSDSGVLKKTGERRWSRYALA